MAGVVAVEILSGATTAGCGLLSLVERTPVSAAATDGATSATAWVFDLSPTDHQIAGMPLSLRYSEGACGRYLIASRALEAGEMFLTERPLLIAGAPDRGEAAWARPSLMAFCGASTSVQSTILALHSEPIDHPSAMADGVRDQVAQCKGAVWRRDFSDATLTQALLIFQLNALPLEFAYPQRSGLFKVGSTFNHSCDANTFYHGCDGLGCFTALRPIPIGEPVTLNYLGFDDAIASTPSRQRTLQRTRLFTCRCCRCASRSDLARVVPCPGCHKRTATGLIPPAVTNVANDDTTVHYVCYGSGKDTTHPWRCDSCSTSYTNAQIFPRQGVGLMSGEGLEKMMEDVLTQVGKQLESIGFACTNDALDDATRMITATFGARHWTACKISHLRLRCLGPGLLNPRKSSLLQLLSMFHRLWVHSVQQQLVPPAYCSDAILLCCMSFLEQSISVQQNFPPRFLARVLACVTLQGVAPSVKEGALRLLDRYGVPTVGASSANYLKSNGDSAHQGEALLFYQAALILLVDLPCANAAAQLRRDIATARSSLV